MNTGYPSIDKPWLKYYSEGAADTAVPEMSIYQMLVDGKEGMAGQPAINYLGRRITYREYFAKILKFAKSLKALGVAPDEIVMLILPNIPECRELVYAANYTGATAFPVNPLMAPKQIGEAIIENDIRVVFLFEGFASKFAEIFDGIEGLTVVVIRGDESAPSSLRLAAMAKRMLGRDAKQKRRVLNARTLGDFEKLGNGVSESKPYFNPNHVAAVIGTSGTTGVPKLVCLTDGNLNAHAIQHFVGLDTRPGEKLMDVIIPALAYGLCVMHYSSVLGLEAIVVPSFPTDIFDLLVKHRPDHFTGGPVHFEGLARLDARARKMLPDAKNMVSGGTALPSWVESTLNRSEAGFVEERSTNAVYVRSGYGCLENCGACTYAKNGSYKFGGLGIPLPLETMGVFELGTDRELGYDARGEICVTGPTVMMGYLNNPEETAAVLIAHRDGRVWLHTKDIGYVDEDGHFFLVDRAKNIFARQGHNVHPSKVADFIASLNGIESCVVAGMPHPVDGYVPVAFVKPCEIEGQLIFALKKLRQSISKACFNNLDEPSIPHDVVFVDAMPTNMGGKPDVQRLLELVSLDYESHPEPYRHERLFSMKEAGGE